MAFKAHNVTMQHWETKANELGVLEVGSRALTAVPYACSASHNPVQLAYARMLREATLPPKTLRQHRRLCGSSVTI